ncbi:HAMP domain-containing protein [Stenotrophomonas maltophilia]|uniref:ATP-binding protein n=1 Tax=Stenotrophomonas maltophilia TaxID=40324 RepID=UPI00109484F1|nr:ATP-binding protein [Stenotrophomonas maltophilia]TGW15238.1 HAMP domain-containing protein [Stenotrophomonas maltophilia]
MKLPWPRSLLARNFLLLMALALALEFSVFATFYQLLQKPRSEGLATLVASQINTQRAILAALPPGERDDVIQRINAEGAMRISPAIEGNASRGEASGGIWLADFARRLERRLPPGSQPAITHLGAAHVRMQVGDQAYWLTLPLHVQLRDRAMTVAIATSGLIVGLMLLAAWLIQRRINRPLRQLQRATHALGSGRAPGRLPEDGPSELAAVTRQFNRMAENLERNESMRTLMLAGISHDIRTPLTKLRLLLAMKQLDEHIAGGYIQQIGTILGQFLDFGRTEGDEAPSVLDVNILVQQLAAEFGERGDTFALNLDSALPAMRLRPLALQRAIANLMENAVRYGRIGLAVDTQVGDGCVSIRVRDAGPGIPPDQVEYLMRPFTRADDARSNNGGTGLGLAIVDRLARIHGGDLRLESPPEGGLHATIVLPVQA